MLEKKYPCITLYFRVSLADFKYNETEKWNLMVDAAKEKEEDLLMYFAGVSKENLKSHYRKLAMKMHPDRGGNTADFQAMQREYDNLTSGKETSYSKSSWYDEYKEYKEDEETKSYHDNDIFGEYKDLGMIGIKKG